MERQEIYRLLQNCPDKVSARVMKACGMETPNIKVGDNIEITGCSSYQGLRRYIGQIFVVRTTQMRNFANKTSDSDIVVTIYDGSGRRTLSWELGHYKLVKD